MFWSLLKVVATGKSKGYARIIDTVTFKYFRYLSQTKKIQDVGKWVKLSTSWKKNSFGTKESLQRFRARNLQRRLQLSEKRRRLQLSEKRDPGAEWYKICTKIISLCIIASLSHNKESSSMGKLSRKRKSVEETAELDIRADTIEDEIIDLVDPVEETAPALDDVSTDENLETIETNLDLFLVEGEELDDTLDEELMGVNVGDSNETLTNKNDADLDFEKSLVKMFETTELLAAELVEKSSQTKKEGEAIRGWRLKPLLKRLGLGR
jgi:hypothetical protein